MFERREFLKLLASLAASAALPVLHENRAQPKLVVPVRTDGKPFAGGRCEIYRALHSVDENGAHDWLAYVVNAAESYVVRPDWKDFIRIAGRDFFQLQCLPNRYIEWIAPFDQTICVTADDLLAVCKPFEPAV